MPKSPQELGSRLSNFTARYASQINEYSRPADKMAILFKLQGLVEAAYEWYGAIDPDQPLPSDLTLEQKETFAQTLTFLYGAVQTFEHFKEEPTDPDLIKILNSFALNFQNNLDILTKFINKYQHQLSVIF